MEANAISESADTITHLAEQIRDTSHEVESIRTAEEIRGRSMQIRQSVTDIHAALPGVTDKTPWWGDMIRWVAIAAAGAALVWLLYATGVASAIRVALGWIPRRKVTEAEMAVATLASDKPETLREWIAMKRAQDPEFDAAWKRANQESK